MAASSRRRRRDAAAATRRRRRRFCRGEPDRGAAPAQVDLPVLAFEDDDDPQLTARVVETAAAAGGDVIIMGCAGMGPGLARAVTAALGKPVVEPVEAAVRLCDALAAAGLAGPASKPLAQELDGLDEIFLQGYDAREPTGAAAPSLAATAASPSLAAAAPPSLAAAAPPSLAAATAPSLSAAPPRTPSAPPALPPRDFVVPPGLDDGDDVLSFEDYADGAALDRKLGPGGG